MSELTDRLDLGACAPAGGGVDEEMLMGWTMPDVTKVPPIVVGVGRILTDRLLD